MTIEQLRQTEPVKWVQDVVILGVIPTILVGTWFGLEWIWKFV